MRFPIKFFREHQFETKHIVTCAKHETISSCSCCGRVKKEVLRDELEHDWTPFEYTIVTRDMFVLGTLISSFKVQVALRICKRCRVQQTFDRGEEPA